MGVVQSVLFPAGFGPVAMLLRGFVYTLPWALYKRDQQSVAVTGGFFALLLALVVIREVVMKKKPNPPPSPPIGAGKTRICIAGFTHSAPTSKAHYMADIIAKAFPDKFETWYYWDSGSAFYGYIIPKFDSVPFPPHLKGHSTSPFVWLERGAEKTIEPIGGAKEFSAWVKDAKNGVSGNKRLLAEAETSPGLGCYTVTGYAYHLTNGKGKKGTVSP